LQLRASEVLFQVNHTTLCIPIGAVFKYSMPRPIQAPQVSQVSRQAQPKPAGIATSQFGLPTLKGRGSARDVPHRYAVWQREAVSDGWDTEEGLSTDEHQSLPITQVQETLCKSALNANDSPDLGFTHSINPYRGCEHGCSYCYARPGHSYLNLSPGLDFETRLVVKTNLAEVLRRELTSPNYRPGKLVLGGVTDVYQPVEKRYGITRQVLSLLNDLKHPAGLVTKGSLIERDLDLLSAMSQWQGVAVYITLTTLDAELARRMEPRAASPSKRLALIRRLTDAGVRVGVSVSPQIPFLNVDLEQCLEAARDAGASSAFYTVLRLPQELATVFQEWLFSHYPDKAQRVMNRVHELHGGRIYRSDFGLRHSGQGVWSELIAQRFAKACQRLGLHREATPLNLSLFKPATDPRSAQLSLL
jgi:DNA repair photolyase